ncbi:Glyoxalase/Bleomycin resistance protein/Dioxygenase superfamily protein [uncultured archaeon]|nr:Glyoxalase/Bleomycin resistance protein/Dioxygenase superfamily protein [uncultured archaeon]
MGLFYTSIRARDLKKSVDFYTKRMGMKVVERWSPVPGEKIVNLLSKDTGQRLRIMWYSKECEWYEPYKKGSEMDHLVFDVDDARKEYDRLVKNGAKAATKLFERPGMAMGFVKDPDGIWVGVRSEEGRKKK